MCGELRGVAAHSGLLLLLLSCEDAPHTHVTKMTGLVRHDMRWRGWAQSINCLLNDTGDEVVAGGDGFAEEAEVQPWSRYSAD